VAVIAVTSTTVSSTVFIGLRRRAGSFARLTYDRADGVRLCVGVGAGGDTWTGTGGGGTTLGTTSGTALGRPRGHSPS
jgi:hypothetical protein